MPYLELLTIILGVDIGLAAVAAIFAGAWVRTSRIDSMQADLDKLWEKLSAIPVLETKMVAIETGIKEIKDLLKK